MCLLLSKIIYKNFSFDTVDIELPFKILFGFKMNPIIETSIRRKIKIK